MFDAVRDLHDPRLLQDVRRKQPQQRPSGVFVPFWPLQRRIQPGLREVRAAVPRLLRGGRELPVLPGSEPHLDAPGMPVPGGVRLKRSEPELLKSNLTA